MEGNCNTDQPRPFFSCFFLESQMHAASPPAFLSSGKQIFVSLTNQIIGKQKVSRDKALKICSYFYQKGVYNQLKLSRNDTCHSQMCKLSVVWQNLL